jgi:WS/DGAT/MGAT family acyltransferase
MAAAMGSSAGVARRLSTQDAGFLYGESRTAPLHIGGVSIFDGEIRFETALQYMKDRIHLVPRYRQRLLFAPFNLNHAMLVDDPDFKIENHFKRHKLKGNTQAEMLREALDIFEPLLDRGKPLWEIYMLEGLKGRAAMLTKVHHALVDGVSGMEIQRLTSDFTPETPPPPPPKEAWNPPALPSPTEVLIGAARDFFKAQLDSTSRALEELVRNPAEVTERTNKMVESMQSIARTFARPIVTTPWNAALISSKRSVTLCRYPFADFRAIRSAFGGTVNDVVLTILSEAAARYLKYHGYATGGGEMRIGCPVNVRRPEEQTDLGNRVSIMFPTVPADSMDIAQRHQRVCAETERIKKDQIPQTLDRMMDSGNLMPPALIEMMSRIGQVNMDTASAIVRSWNFKPSPGGPAMAPPGINLMASNVPGFQIPTYFCGRKLEEMLAVFPLSGNIGYGVGITSYNQEMFLNLTSDPTLLPDLDRMKLFCDEVFEEFRRGAVAKLPPGMAAGVTAKAQSRRA